DLSWASPSAWPPTRRAARLASPSNNAATGPRTTVSPLIRGAMRSASESAKRAANDFGMISPKVMTVTVMKAVAMPAPGGPHTRMAMTVASADAEMLTTLFPIKMVAINLFGFSRRSDSIWARASPLSASERRRNRLTERRAVSEAEKNAEPKSSPSSTHNSQEPNMLLSGSIEAKSSFRAMLARYNPQEWLP